MNKETYEALRGIMAYMRIEKGWDNKELSQDAEKVENWIDEVAKDYTECENKDSNGNACYDCENGGVCGSTPTE